MPTARVAIIAAALLIVACRLEHAESGRPPGGDLTAADSLARIEQDSAITADVLVSLRAYYDLMSAHDWRGVRGRFWSGATVAARAMPAGEHAVRVWTMSADDFVRRTSEGQGKSPGFAEHMLHADVKGYGDVADAWVIYEGKLGRQRDTLRTIRGVDAFHLLRDGGTWKIASLTSAAEVAGRPLALPPRKTSRRVAAATPSRAEPRSSL